MSDLSMPLSPAVSRDGVASPEQSAQILKRLEPETLVTPGAPVEQRTAATAGTLAESIAADFLALQGCQILACNERCADVEVDLLAREGTTLVVAEVKLRSRTIVHAVDALRPKQLRRLYRAAHALLEQNHWAESIRIDVVALQYEAHSARLLVQHLRGVSWL